MIQTPGTFATSGPRCLRVVLLHNRDAASDEQLAQRLESALAPQGHKIFVDRHVSQGVEWAAAIEREIREADVLILLISAESMKSETMAFEIETANDLAQANHGKPSLIPIRMAYSGPFPEPLAGIVDTVPQLLWETPEDDENIVRQTLERLNQLGAARPALRVVPKPGLRLIPRATTAPRPRVISSSNVPPPTPQTLEAVGGAVPLNSEFYLSRPVDKEFHTALTRYDSIVLLKGARQMGKTSLLARGLQFSRERGAKIALTDFQKMNASNLETVTALYLTLAESLADQLGLSVLPGDVWDERRGANVNFERYLRKEVLGKLNAPLVWGLDEVDRLFSCPFGSEVFGLFRSWHNERALDPSGPWAGLTLAIAYATEAHLFITDMNQSPFNVGTRLALEDFTREQVSELNRRYRSPLKDESELARFTEWLGGHPYLVRRGLHELAARKIGIVDFEKEADQDEGIFSDHLRRILVLLAKDPDLTEVVRGVLQGKGCPNPESFYRLRSAGVIAGNSQQEVRPRSKLYANYLRRHLL